MYFAKIKIKKGDDKYAAFLCDTAPEWVALTTEDFLKNILCPDRLKYKKINFIKKVNTSPLIMDKNAKIKGLKIDLLGEHIKIKFWRNR